MNNQKTKKMLTRQWLLIPLHQPSPVHTLKQQNTSFYSCYAGLLLYTKNSLCTAAVFPRIFQEGGKKKCERITDLYSCRIGFLLYISNDEMGDEVWGGYGK